MTICRGARRRFCAHAGYLPLLAASAPFCVAISQSALTYRTTLHFFSLNFWKSPPKGHMTGGALKPLVLAGAAAAALSAPSQQKEPGLAAVSLGWRLSWRA